MNTNIDWEGRCKFDTNGKVISFIKENSLNNFNMLPIPRDEESLMEAKKADMILKSIMQPASKDQIAVCLKKLSLHCGMATKTPQDIKYLFLDYCNDLMVYPLKLIEEACRIYRTSHEGNQFMPSIGKLLSIIEPKYRKMKLLEIRIDKILGVYVEPAKRQNKVISLDKVLENIY